MPVVGLSPTQKELYRPGVQVAYAVEGGRLRIVPQVPGGCYAAARDYIYELRGSTKRVQWKRDSTHMGPDDSSGSWAEIRVGEATVGWIQAGDRYARLADWY